MNTERRGMRQWPNWTLQIKVWKALMALIVALVLLFWFRVVHQDDEILALIRNEVVTSSDQRSWVGSFVNTNDRALRDVAVAVEFLDNQNRRVGKADAQAAELPFRSHLDLRAPLPSEAVKIRVYSVQWRMGERPVLMGPFREPWNFGYLMADPAIANH